MKYLFFIFFLAGCTQFIKYTDEEYSKDYSSSKKELSVLFSHNINGETHPCGCRNFPLGGIPNVNGIIKSIAKESDTLYVDVGDTFFPSTIVPKYILESTTYTAEKIAEALDNMGLSFITPGDQDFSLGQNFLIELTKKYSFQFLISNPSSALKLKHKKWVHIKTDKEHLFLLGVVSPNLSSNNSKGLFTPIRSAIKKQLLEINTKFKNLKNKKFILLSHSGIEEDRILAEEFPIFSWIIGAHSQSFLKEPETYNKTNVVQVLSRNHYLAEIQLNKNKYIVHAADEEAINKIKPNSFIQWLANYKAQLEKIQEKEQSVDLAVSEKAASPTYASCLDCHDKQVKFWSETPHSIAFTTLIKEKSAHNPSCIGCHSLKFQKENGFLSAKTIIKSEEKDFSIDNYWKEFNKSIKLKKSVRNLKKDDIRRIHKKWEKLDLEKKVTHNYANVQCLHCHDKSEEHPFDSDKAKSNKINHNKCIGCHTKDQSPEWYQKDSKGLATSIDKTYFSKKLKEVSCPKLEKE